MKKKKFKNNRKLLIIALLLIFLVGTTLAIYSSTKGFNNKLNIANYDIQIEEEFYGNWGTKAVYIFNNDNTPVVLRVSYNEMMKLETESGQITYMSNKVKVDDAYVDVVDKEWTNEWLNNFTLGQDGWYYYKKILTEKGSPNERIQILKSINLGDSVKSSPKYNEYLNALYNLDFNFEAVQATPDAIKELWGEYVESVEIDTDNNVTWNFKSKIPGEI